MLKRMANRGARFTRDDEGEPVGVRPRILGGDDFHRLPALELHGQRRKAPVHAAGHAGVADVRVHRIGEVHGGGALGQLENAPLGGKHVDLVGEEIDL